MWKIGKYNDIFWRASSMDYNELYKKYQILLKENDELKKEISLYHQKYGSISDKVNIKS